jgi:cobalt-precorrin-5B (C1)-methyltransferase
VFSGGYVRRLYDVQDSAFEEVYPHLDAPETSVAIDEPYVRSGQKQLRRGITTGTCAALATAGATRLLLTGEAPSSVGLITPKGLCVEVEPASAELACGVATCAVRKDAGDDPDVTDGILVVASVERTAEGVSVDGGEGVGRVTLPGLDQPPGAAAINRVPRQMIEEQARAVADELGYEEGLAIRISIPGGEELARRTLNQHVGVVGGLSILGTSGIEEPMSEQALVDTIELELRQARSQGATTALLLPGNYAEDFVRATYPELACVAQVKYANFLGDALDAAVSLGYAELLVVGHIGKLVKLAGGIMNTHSKVADCRMELMCAHVALCGASSELCNKVMEAVTTDAAVDVLNDAGCTEQVMQSLLAAMQRHLDQRVGDALRVGAVVFSNQHGLLGMTAIASEILSSWRAKTEGGQ